MNTAAQGTKTSISSDGRTATVSIPVTFLQRGGRKQILAPPGSAPWSPAPRVDNALVKAVVRAHRWRQMLESGEYASSAELEDREGQRFLCEPHPPTDPDCTRHHRGDPGWAPAHDAAVGCPVEAVAGCMGRAAFRIVRSEVAAPDRTL
jgi:hypothetical protein